MGLGFSKRRAPTEVGEDQKEFKRQKVSNPEPFATAETENGYPMAILDLSAYGGGAIPRSLAELKIMEFAGSIRDKPDWHRKVFDERICFTWHKEAMEGFDLETIDGSDRSCQMDYAIAENRWWAANYFSKPSRPAAVDGVFCRDSIESKLLDDLKIQVGILRSKPAIGSDKEDRHPGTPQMVDLVHPSLYCYERGKTLVLEGVGSEALKQPEWETFLGSNGVLESCKEAAEQNDQQNREAGMLGSKNGLQWLPSEFVVEGKNCEIKSYINSLHPKEHSDMYDLIGTLFCKALPLFKDVLETAPRERGLRVPVNPMRWWSYDEDYDPFEDDSDDSENRVFVPPQIPLFKEPTYNKPHTSVSLKDRPLQVIVKIASLELKPGESYEGGVWHVEGTLDERIVATACCYLESENVSGGDLAFRTAVRMPPYEQYDDEGVFLAYGLKDALIQNLGACSTPAGRILAWPNTLQHRVGPVQLIDETKPGKRTILCFFLVDPTLRIRSTATVPPQQQAWISHKSGGSNIDGGEEEVSPMGMTYDEACERRQLLMDERQAIFGPQGGRDPFYERSFSLCEH